MFLYYINIIKQNDMHIAVLYIQAFSDYSGAKFNTACQIIGIMFIYEAKFARILIISFNQVLYIKIQARAILTSLFYLLNNSCM